MIHPRRHLLTLHTARLHSDARYSFFPLFPPFSCILSLPLSLSPSLPLSLSPSLPLFSLSRPRSQNKKSAEEWRKKVDFLGCHNMGDKISDLSFFKSVRPVVLKCLEDLFQFAIYKPGEIIVKEGDPGDAFYILSRGVVSVSVMQEGVDTPVVDLKEGQVFGEAALMESTPRTASCTAKELCLLLVLRKDHFQNFFNVCPEMKENLEDGLHLRTAQKLRKLNVPFFRSMGDKKLQVRVEQGSNNEHAGETWERHGRDIEERHRGET